ncbi:MAG: MBL fold metallo-hydrolase [Gammaproteobacteria bacterium]|nr:MBL fold metallo-hydrolase [Gammaproteobacteria bacterium]
MRRTTTLTLLLLAGTGLAQPQEPSRVTIIYDAMGVPSELERDWGFAALVEYNGRRILFDTGNDAEILRRNVERLGLDLSHLDAAVISHRHGDHTSGLSYLLEVNPAIRIYTPLEGAFFARGPLPEGFLVPDPDVPPDMRYFGGHVPEKLNDRRSYIWDADFVTVTGTTEVFPGFYLLTTRSEKPGMRDMNEVSLAVRTPRGLAMIVGCSHPGIETILEEAARIDTRIYTAIGGFHLVRTPRSDIQATATTLHDMFKLDRVAPAHCTSEPGFAVFMDRFGDRYDRAGVGSVIDLP